MSNPFVQGLIGVLIGLVCVVGSSILKIPELMSPGQTLFGIGLGYLGHAALVQPPGPNPPPPAGH